MSLPQKFDVNYDSHNETYLQRGRLKQEDFKSKSSLELHTVYIEKGCH